MNESMKELYEKSIEVLNERGVTIADIAELVKKLQKPYDPDINLKNCIENVDAVLKKREVAHAILTGVALDQLAEKKELPAVMPMEMGLNNLLSD